MISDAGGKILVVGCGYLGQAVAARLMRRGLGVVALTRNPETAATLAAMGVPTAALVAHNVDLADVTYPVLGRDGSPRMAWLLLDRLVKVANVGV